MRCESYREKFVNEELSGNERLEFEQHLKTCEDCRDFYQSYENMKDVIKLRYSFEPSNDLQSRIVKGIQRRENFKKMAKFAFPTAAVILFGTFYIVGGSLTGGGRLYEKAVSAGISMLNSDNAATSTYANSSNLSYLVKIKYASDQF